jgi:hydrogenase large subunit
MERITALRTLMEETREFVQKVYYPDMLAIASAYKEWFTYGKGVVNYLAVPEMPEDTTNTTFALPGAIINNGDIKGARIITNHQDPALIGSITENVAHAWYEGSGSHHPREGETKPHYTDFEDNGKYSWCKAPRLNGKAVQVGPPAQLFAAYAGGNQKVIIMVSSLFRRDVLRIVLLPRMQLRQDRQDLDEHLIAEYLEGHDADGDHQFGQGREVMPPLAGVEADQQRAAGNQTEFQQEEA